MPKCGVFLKTFFKSPFIMYGIEGAKISGVFRKKFFLHYAWNERRHLSACFRFNPKKCYCDFEVPFIMHGIRVGKIQPCFDETRKNPPI